MEPLKPTTKESILRDSPQAAPEDIEEYERLLAERFTVDPDVPMAPEDVAAHDERESRLLELQKKLFPKQ